MHCTLEGCVIGEEVLSVERETGRDGWIACADEMPDDEISVFVHAPGSSDPVFPAFREGGCWFDLTGWPVRTPVTDWRQYPDPPEVGKQG